MIPNTLIKDKNTKYTCKEKTANNQYCLIV